MAVPKKKKSRSKRDSRRANHSLKSTTYVICQNCSAPRMAHRVCNDCGWYKDRYVLDVVEVEV